MTNEKAKHFFEEYIGEQASDFFPLAQSGSARINFVGRISDQKYIITFNENIAENKSFLYFSKLFSDLNLNAPQIFKISDDQKTYIQEFLGEQTLSEIIQKEGFSARTKSLVEQTLDRLFQLQQKTENKVDYSKTFEYENYNELPILNDLFYFKSFIADVLEIPYHKATLLSEFKKLITKIENLEPKGLMIRDFQARNIMVDKNDRIFFIDYQSAMNGPLIYDVVSFLFQAKADFPADFKEEMLHYYYSLWKDDDTIRSLQYSLPYIQCIRLLQVLGAYGFRGLIQRKEHFISSLDQGVKNVTTFAENWNEMSEYPELQNLISQLNSPLTQQKIKILTNKN